MVSRWSGAVGGCDSSGRFLSLTGLTHLQLICVRDRDPVMPTIFSTPSSLSRHDFQSRCSAWTESGPNWLLLLLALLPAAHPGI